MLTNNTITYYHKTINTNTRLENWTKYSFTNVWEFGKKGSTQNSGYENANNIEVRIPMEQVSDTSIFAIGDIIAIGSQNDITSQSDLNGIEFYNVTNIAINDFGNNKHIHLGGV